jgi:hypothetical protein
MALALTPLHPLFAAEASGIDLSQCRELRRTSTEDVSTVA